MRRARERTVTLIDEGLSHAEVEQALAAAGTPYPIALARR
jgi:hypothetical protein